MLSYRVAARAPSPANDGVTEQSARLPGAVDAAIMIAAIYFFLRRFRPGSELDAALITASCAGIIGFAHAASTDMPLAATFTIALLAWFRWYENQRKTNLAHLLFMSRARHAGQRPRGARARGRHSAALRGRQARLERPPPARYGSRASLYSSSSPCPGTSRFSCAIPASSASSSSSTTSPASRPTSITIRSRSGFTCPSFCSRPCLGPCGSSWPSSSVCA